MRPGFEVTVCVPTYQGQEFFAECLDSIAAQDLRDAEVLILDDGSTDATLEIAESYRDRIAELRIITNPVRLGAVANVNRSIELARGRWIKPVFQDDSLEPGCLTSMLAARQPRVKVVACARNYLYEPGVPTWRREACEYLIDQALDQRFGPGLVEPDQLAAVVARFAADRLPHLNFVGEPVSVLFERAAARRARGFDTDLVQLWDYELMLRMALRSGIVVVDQRLANFRVHENSETAHNLSGSTFRADVIDRLRLHVAYATGSGYRRVRRAAARAEPTIDLTALALGVAEAARTLATEVPPSDQADAAALVATSTRALPRRPLRKSARVIAATEACTAMLMELSADPPAPADETSQALPVQDLGPPPSATDRVTRALRTTQWWGHMVGPIVAIAYLQLGWRQAPPGEGIARVLALVVSAAALAGYGYVVNDACDVEPDRLAGKPNAMAGRSWSVRLALIGALAALGAVPWIWIRLSPAAAAALAGIYLMPLLYSAPPVRLKERTILGPLGDATNAFILPALFIIALFAPLGPSTGPPALMVAGALAWTTGRGLRAILIHQVADENNDRRSGTRTLVGRLGADRARAAMRCILFPLEMAGLAALTATVATWSWGLVAVGLVWAVGFNGARLTGVIERGLATTTIDQGWFLYWCQVWPALGLSVALAISDPWYLVLVVLVLVLFWPRVRSGLGIARRETMRELRKVRA